MPNTVEELKAKLKLFLYLVRLFFELLGLIAFIAWLRLLISGEYNDMLTSVAFVIGKSVSAIGLVIVIGFGIIFVFKKRKDRGVEVGIEPELQPLPGNMNEEEYINALKTKKGDLSYNDIQGIIRDHPQFKTLTLEMMNWIKFWTESKNKYRMTPFYTSKTRDEIKRMEKEARKRTPPPLEIKTA